ncbi:MAG: flagellar basal body rod protein FlgC [Deltaproteobacteria bacterium]|nr:flagellar basal body rod protein FlgC [Deltaproteobacteria bacterium]
MDFNTFTISASGMEAQRVRLNTIASNLANVNTTKGVNGEAYRRKDVVFAAMPEQSSFGSILSAATGEITHVKVMGVVEDEKPFKVVYDPKHPDANKEGYVEFPNINSIEEMVNMLSAIRSYEANVTVFNASKSMAMKALEIGR